VKFLIARLLEQYARMDESGFMSFPQSAFIDEFVRLNN